MRFLSGLVVICLLVLLLGIWRGWFHVASDHAVNQPSMTFTVDKDKMQTDKNIVIHKAQEELSHAPATQPAPMP